MSKRTKLRSKADRERTQALLEELAGCKLPVNWVEIPPSSKPKPIIINQLGAKWPLGITIKD